MDSTDPRSRVLEEIESRRDDLTDLLGQLVRIPSVVGDEGECQRFVAQIYRDLGLEVDVFEADRAQVESHPSFVEVKWPYQGRPNVVGRLAGDPAARSLILNGHIDVVSPEPVASWTHDPWGAEVEDGRLYGRGAADMKSGIAAAFFALKSLLARGLRPRGTVLLESAIEEEAGGGGGTLACFMRGHRADGMVCVEPQALRLTVAHAGINYCRIRVPGRSAHAGRAHLGVNAAGKALKIYEALVALDLERAARVRYPLFERREGRSCNLSVGTFHAGDWPSTVPGSAVMEVRVGFAPGERMAEVKREVEESVAAAARADDWLREHPPTVEWFGWHTEPWEQDPEHPFVRSFAASVREALGFEPEVSGLAAALDTRFGSYFGVPSLAFGPRGENYHGIDEWVEVDSVVQTAKALAVAIIDWCGVAPIA